jgi:hypothetical protein
MRAIVFLRSGELSALESAAMAAVENAAAGSVTGKPSRTRIRFR